MDKVYVPLGKKKKIKKMVALNITVPVPAMLTSL